MKLLSPETLIQDRYKIVHLIGKGGMGEVYLAVDQRLGSAIALKRTFFSDDELLATAFEREARILANLRHPILPKVSDHFIEGDNQYLVMEHIAGDDLSKRLEKTQQHFPLSWVLFWADQLLDALNYLHTHQPPIIHRDIKPQNLKLTNDNQIVLLDFGLSKNSIGETRFSSGGSTGSVVGYTPHYAPMEQIRGTGTSAKSDLYSLSATIYQLLTNIVPPDALTRADSLLNNMPDPLKPINLLNKEVTPEVSKVILKGMEISQDKRHPNAREMQKQLRDAYSKLQNVMSAQTVAFSLDDQQTDIEPPVSQFAQSDESAYVNPDAKTIGSNFENVPDSKNSENNETPFSPTPEVEEQDFDATIKYDGEIAEDSFKQSDVKTEVLLAGDYPEINSYNDEVETPEVENDFKVEDDFSDESYSTQDNFSEQNNEFADDNNYSPDATVPLINFDGETDGFENQEEDLNVAGETDFFSIPSSDSGNSIGETNSFADSDDNSDELPFGGETQINHFASEEQISSEAAGVAAVSSAPVKKKKSKALPIILGLGAVFVLVIGAVGGVGWYMMSNGNIPFFGTGEGTPSPEETIEEPTTPEPSQEIIITNTDGDNTNESGNTNEGNMDGDNTNASDTPVTKTPESTTTQTPTQRPTRRPPPTQRPTRRPPPTQQPTRKPPPPTKKPTINQ